MDNNISRTSSNWTGRTPRSMSQAFGPYARLSATSTAGRSSVIKDAAWLALAVLAFAAMMFIGHTAGF